MIARLAVHVGLASMVMLACRERESPSAATKLGALPEGIVARVGDSNVSAQIVSRIVEQRQLPVNAALELAVSDAVFGEAARTRLNAYAQRSLGRSAHARALLAAIAAESADAGPANAQEVAEAVRENWAELDRPVSVRTTHAIAMLPKAGKSEEARQAAETLKQAVSQARDPAAFIQAAQSVKVPGIQIRAERLPFITPQGYGISVERPRVPLTTFDTRFAEAANAIAEAGEQSPIVETSYGFHIILLEERLPARHLTLEEGRQSLAEELRTRRSARLKKDLLTKLTQSTPVEISRDVDAQTATLLR